MCVFVLREEEKGDWELWGEGLGREIWLNFRKEDY